MLVQVDYNNLPIRCRLCLSTSDLIKDCGRVLGQNKTQLGQLRPHHQVTNTARTTNTNKLDEQGRDKDVTPTKDREVEGLDGLELEGS